MKFYQNHLQKKIVQPTLSLAKIIDTVATYAMATPEIAIIFDQNME